MIRWSTWLVLGVLTIAFGCGRPASGTWPKMGACAIKYEFLHNEKFLLPKVFLYLISSKRILQAIPRLRKRFRIFRTPIFYIINKKKKISHCDLIACLQMALSNAFWAPWVLLQQQCAAFMTLQIVHLLWGNLINRFPCELLHPFCKSRGVMRVWSKSQP